MKLNGIRPVRTRRHKVTTDSRHTLGFVANILDGDFLAEAVNRKWAGDITYIWTNEGWLYLAVVIDLFSRRIIGWAASDRMKKVLAIRALDMAVRLRTPSPGHHDREARGTVMDKNEERMRQVVGGVDTHKDLHVAAIVDEQDHVIGTQSFPTTRQGYRQMLAWMRAAGDLVRVGVESTGSYGAGLLRYLQAAEVEVLEVPAPDRHDRRRRGKNDDLDAQNAAHAAFAGQRTVTPRRRDGMVEALRVLRACRKTAVSARRISLQMIQNTIIAAPDTLREYLRSMTRMQLIRTLAASRPDLTAYRDIEAAYRISLKSLARRYLELHDEIGELDLMIKAIVEELAPDLIARNSIGYNGAAQLLLTAGDNPDRLKSEASFAALCGVTPVPASSGKTIRHRLNRGGDRAANSALHIIAIGRLRTDEKTRAYVARRVAEGHSKLEVIRILKRYIAREVYGIIIRRHRHINATRFAT